MNPHSVIAYRWGTTNDHSYPVGAYPDFESAKAAADAECEYRGGKYGTSSARPTNSSTTPRAWPAKSGLNPTRSLTWSA
jgi:hypothetical protein